MAIEKLVDSQNFGEWKETINDVIDSVNGYDGINEAVKESIDGALSAGQIGEYLSISSLKDYDKYTFNGSYHMDASCINGPERGIICKLYCLALSNGYITQIAITNNKVPTELYIRSKTVTGTSWTTWSKVVRREEADETYFPFVGGTIEGSVDIAEELSITGEVTALSNITTLGDLVLKDSIYHFVLSNEGSRTVFKVVSDGDKPTTEYPISIDNVSKIADINGTAKYASNLHLTALSQATDDYTQNVAASAFALATLSEYLEVNYVKVTGGEFRGIVKFGSHVDLASGVTVRIPSELNLRVNHGLNIVSNESFANLYLERDNEPIGEEYPFIIGTRTRTGITDYEVGSPVYEMGGFEFWEDSTKWRLRKQECSTGENVKPNVYLEMKNTEEGTEIVPSDDNKISLGSTAQRFAQVYASTDTISTSDANAKTDIGEIDKNLLKNWGKVKWHSFRFKDAVEEKGASARTHTGVIAQEVFEAIPDAETYGFFCYDEWDEIKDKEYIQVPVILENEDGTTEPSYVTECKETVKRPAGSQYSIRYQELQAIENQNLRQRISELEAELARIKHILDID